MRRNQTNKPSAQRAPTLKPPSAFVQSLPGDPDSACTCRRLPAVNTRFVFLTCVKTLKRRSRLEQTLVLSLPSALSEPEQRSALDAFIPQISLYQLAQRRRRGVEGCCGGRPQTQCFQDHTAPKRPSTEDCVTEAVPGLGGVPSCLKEKMERIRQSSARRSTETRGRGQLRT